MLVSLCNAMGLNDVNVVGETNVPAIASRPAGVLNPGPIMELL